ncbi:hypothetical protein BJX61DRAFT_40569 [Aspergillus egyptiacus]|nr:hypothetical protein BJX61DRAFT_40569 [Aspergillus egyptiacus]
MVFWKGWALWQKLSVALAFLLLLVLAYSFTVLSYNRRKIRRQAAEEEKQRAEQEAEMGQLGSEASGIPFGASALEKGVEVEGIWTMKRHSFIKPASIAEKQETSVFGQLLRHKSTASSTQTPHIIEPVSQRTSASIESQSESVFESVHIDTFRSSRPPQVDIGPIGSQKSSDYERPLSRGWFASRSSWMKPIVGYRRMSARDGRRRGSSEDFRRRLSKLFDETLPPGRPAEMFQLTPIYQVSAESLGKGSTEKVIEPVVTK